MIRTPRPPALRAARPPDGTTVTVRAEDLHIGDRIAMHGLILDVRTISRASFTEVEIGWTAGDEHLATTVLGNDEHRSVILPRPLDGAGVDRFDDELAAAS